MFVSTAATMVTQSHVHVKKEPLEEVLPSAAVYSTCMCVGRVYGGYDVHVHVTYCHHYSSISLLVYHSCDVKEYLIHYTADDTVNTETGMEIQSLGSPLALVPPAPGMIMESPPTSAQLTGKVTPYVINDNTGSWCVQYVHAHLQDFVVLRYVRRQP